MNKYIFNWSLAPAVPAEYTVSVLPFDVVVRQNKLTLTADADPIEEQKLQNEADRIAHGLALSLSYRYATRFEVTYQSYQVLAPDGGQRVSVSAHITGDACLIADMAEFEVRDADGNVVDSSSLQKERQHKVDLQGLMELTRRATGDANLRDMLNHWHRYVGDPDGRLHPLYDVLQVVECVYHDRGSVASALNMSGTDLSYLAKITNDPTVLNGRDPGKSQGPHRLATGAEVEKCERIARAIIDSYASKVAV
jgi:hypothetical protein